MYKTTKRQKSYESFCIYQITFQSKKHPLRVPVFSGIIEKGIPDVLRQPGRNRKAESKRGSGVRENPATGEEQNRGREKGEDGETQSSARETQRGKLVGNC